MNGLIAGCMLALAASATTAPPQQETFASPDAAAKALIAAAGVYDLEKLKKILGPDGVDLVETEDHVQSKAQALAFAKEAGEKTQVVRDKKNPKIATVIVGDENWPSPIPIVEKGGRWSFDTKKGREEILYRRIGSNELAAIDICEGFVEAQREYSETKHDGSQVNQYAQRIVSTPGKHDGLAWKTADGTWEGPVGEGIARVIQEGYSDKTEPYRGYYFKVLKRQGPAAPLGEMNYVIGGVMIGGFALVAAPADYEVTGVKTFIVSNEGIVYEKDFGPATMDEFRLIESYNPDKTWEHVHDHGLK